VEEIRFKNKARRFGKLSPGDVLDELERIRQKHDGQLTPVAVVREAKSPKALLHAAFEWDDTKAAHLHRLNQARGLIRSIIIVRDEESPVPAYLHVTVEKEDEPKQYYQHTNVIIDRPDEFTSAIRELKKKFLDAEASLNAAKQIGQRMNRSDVDVQLLVGIGEALATARAMVDRLQ
jgi:hypothetical protein